MSAEHIRRRLVLKLGGKPDAVYIDKISEYLLQLEKNNKAEVQLLTRSRKKNTLIFSLDNGELYELYNYVDPYKEDKEKKKPKDYKPPEIQIHKIDKMEEEEPDYGPFSILDFVIWTVFLGLAAFSVMIAWLFYNFKFESY